MKTMAREDVMINMPSDIDLLRDRPWSDGMIRKIATEELAKLAFEKTAHLQREFMSVGVFVAYWRALQQGATEAVRKQRQAY